MSWFSLGSRSAGRSGGPRCLARRLLLARDGALGTLAGTRVGLRALAAHREAAAVTDALVGPDLDLAADVRGDLAAQVTLELEVRSEEHTSELQSRENLVCRLLLEKKKKLKQIYAR